jgi:hypothetical protein
LGFDNNKYRRNKIESEKIFLFVRTGTKMTLGEFQHSNQYTNLDSCQPNDTGNVLGIDKR